MTGLALLPEAPLDLAGERIADEQAAVRQGYSLVLGKHAGKLSLWRPGGRETPLSVDLDVGTLGYRLERASHEMLVRAAGGTTEQARTVLDATAGLGRDAALLAMAGYQVSLVEREPVIHALLRDGLTRLQQSHPELAARMKLAAGQATDIMNNAEAAWYAVYLDPMFPPRKKSAAVKKNLLWLQEIGERPLDLREEDRLLSAALSAARKKVIVKRPLRAAPLAGMTPGHSLNGKAVRFDVYVAGH